MKNSFKVQQLNTNTLDFFGINDKTECCQIYGSGIDFENHHINLNQITFLNFSGFKKTKRDDNEILHDCIDTLIQDKWKIVSKPIIYENIKRFIQVSSTKSVIDVLNTIKNYCKLFYDINSTDPLIISATKSISQIINNKTQSDGILGLILWSIYNQHFMNLYKNDINFKSLVDKVTTNNIEMLSYSCFLDSGFKTDSFQLISFLRTDKIINNQNSIFDNTTKMYSMDNPDWIIVCEDSEIQKIIYIEFTGIYANWEKTLQDNINKHIKSAEKPNKGVNYMFKYDTKPICEFDYLFIFSKIDSNNKIILPLSSREVSNISNIISSSNMLKSNKFIIRNIIDNPGKQLIEVKNNLEKL